MSSRLQLALATLVMLAGIVCLGLLHRWLPPGFHKTIANHQAWWLLLGVIAFTIVRRWAQAITDPSPREVQSAVRHAIWSLIVLDACVALLVSPPGWSLLVLCLLIPTIFLGQWIAST